MAPISGSRRPIRSLSGPTTSWPSASPATHAVSVSCTCDAPEPSVRAIWGNAGRYMSIDNGPIALTAPSTTTSRIAAARALVPTRSSWTTEVTRRRLVPRASSWGGGVPANRAAHPSTRGQRAAPTPVQGHPIRAGRPSTVCVHMRTLVTGGAGFIGSNLVDALLARGDEVTVLDDLSTGRRSNLASALAAGATLHEGSIADAGAVAAVLAAARPEAIFHLAAQIDVRRAVEDPAFDATINVVGTATVLEAARPGGVRRAVP